MNSGRRSRPVRCSVLLLLVRRPHRLRPRLRPQCAAALSLHVVAVAPLPPEDGRTSRRAYRRAACPACICRVCVIGDGLSARANAWPRITARASAARIGRRCAALPANKAGAVQCRPAPYSVGLVRNVTRASATSSAVSALGSTRTPARRSARLTFTLAIARRGLGIRAIASLRSASISARRRFRIVPHLLAFRVDAADGAPQRSVVNPGGKRRLPDRTAGTIQRKRAHHCRRNTSGHDV